MKTGFAEALLARKFWSRASILGLLIFAISACATSQQEDPIQPSIDDDSNPADMGYPEDPELAGTEPEPLPTGEPEDMPGPLTDEPFSDSDGTPNYDSGDDIDGGADDSIERADPAYADSFQDPEPYDSTLGDAGIDDDTAPSGADITMPEGGDLSNSFADGDGNREMWVDALQLNVRRQPNFSSSIVRRLRGGEKLMVTVQGRFAKIRDGEFVSRKFLSSSPTRRVTQSEINDAWQRSRYKDTWDGR